MPLEAEEHKVKLDDFLEKHHFSREEYKKSELNWDSLREIAQDHASIESNLQSVGAYASMRLQQVPEIHSLKVRVKDPEHLVAKIIRKKLEKPEISVNLETYRTIITDLVGIRALHLFKDQWRSIHDFITQNWDLHEAPIAYYREGDPADNLEAFREVKCSTVVHKFGYRSIHYIIKSQPDKELYLIELQVRTIFEEGWSEIDHRVRYPRFSSDPHLNQFLTIFNRLAGSADEMGTFIKALSRYLIDQRQEIDVRDKRFAEKEAELKKAISELKISKGEKDELEKKLESLGRSSQIPNRAISFASTAAFTIAGMPAVTPQSISAKVPVLFPSSPRTCSKCKKPYPMLVGTKQSLCPFCGARQGD